MEGNQLPLRFSLLQILFIFTLLTVAFFIGPVCVGIAVFVLTLYANAGRSAAGSLGGLFEIAVLLIFTCVILWMVVPSQSTFPHGRRSTCLNHQRALVVALLNYESAHRQFPPAGEEFRENGLSHSWRVRILPFLGRDDLYKMYDFDEPWDGPNNRKLVELMPEYFHCPFQEKSKAGMTRYKLIVGPGSLFEEGQVRSWARLKDGSSNTIALVEDCIEVNWMKPEDITIRQALSRLYVASAANAPHQEQFEFEVVHACAGCTTWDGSSHGSLPWNPDQDSLAKAFGVDDGVLPDMWSKKKRNLWRRIRYEVLIRYTLFWGMNIALTIHAFRKRTDNSNALAEQQNDD